MRLSLLLTLTAGCAHLSLPEPAGPMQRAGCIAEGTVLLADGSTDQARRVYDDDGEVTFRGGNLHGSYAVQTETLGTTTITTQGDYQDGVFDWRERHTSEEAPGWRRSTTEKPDGVSSVYQAELDEHDRVLRSTTTSDGEVVVRTTAWTPVEGGAEGVVVETRNGVEVGRDEILQTDTVLDTRASNGNWHRQEFEDGLLVFDSANYEGTAWTTTLTYDDRGHRIHERSVLHLPEGDHLDVTAEIPVESWSAIPALPEGDTLTLNLRLPTAELPAPELLLTAIPPDLNGCIQWVVEGVDDPLAKVCGSPQPRAVEYRELADGLMSSETRYTVSAGELVLQRRIDWAWTCPTRAAD